jgi:hypothetical protein
MDAAHPRLPNLAARMRRTKVDERVAALLAAPEIHRTRRQKDYDLRPLIETLTRTASDEQSHTLVMRLAAREGATGRPEEVAEALGWPATSAAYHRQKLYSPE